MSLCIAASTATAAAQPEYRFTLVEAFTPNYNLREAYIWDLNDVGTACGTATREYQVPNGTSITYSGFTWTTLTDKTPLDAITWPRAINNQGLVVGGAIVYSLGTGAVAALIPSPPGGVGPLFATGINDSGLVVGHVLTCNCSNSQGVNQIPFVWDAAQGVRNVPVPGAKDLARVNRSGLGAGNIRGSRWSGYAYDTTTGTYTILSDALPAGPYAGATTTAQDINDAGQIVGDLGASDSYARGYVWSQAAGFTVFAGPGGATSVNVYPQGINSAAVVVGYAQFTPGQSGPFRGFVWDPQRGTRDLNSLTEGIPSGFIIDRALKINDAGWIVGDGHYGPNWGSSRSFVLKPIAPSCYANCDGSTAAPALNVQDFICFLNRYAAGDPNANCDGSTIAPILNVLDFGCFLNAYAAGCP